MKVIGPSALTLCAVLPIMTHGSAPACRVMKPAPAAFAECVAAREARPAAGMARAVRKETQLDVVDVLIAYDLSAQRWLAAKGKGTPAEYSATRLAELNECLSRSRVDTFSFRLAGSVLVEEDATLCRDSSGDVDLPYILEKKLVSTTGRVVATGGWQKVPDVRASTGADIVVVLVDAADEGTVGVSYQLDADGSFADFDLSYIPAFGNWAYGVCSVRSVETDFTLLHEIGHIMGCGHPDVTCASPFAFDLGPQIFDYSSGYYFWIGSSGYTTVMGYNYGGLRPDGTFSFYDMFQVLPLFSSPVLSYRGVPVGTAHNDNRKTLLKTCSLVAQYRVSRLSTAPAPDHPTIFSKEFRPTSATKGTAPYVGAVYDGDEPIALVSLKCGKAALSGKRAGKSKVSAVVMGLDGKRKKAKAVDIICGYDAVATLVVKDWGVLALTLGGEGFVGTLGDGLTVRTASVGGLWPHERALFTVDFESVTAPLPAGTLDDLLPVGDGAVSLLSERGSWRVAKAATVKWAAPKGEQSKRVIVSGGEGATSNLSALRLSYAPKTGTFKGSFRVYALETLKEKTKLRKYVAKVTGFVVSGIGYGTAAMKKIGVYPVSIRQDVRESAYLRTINEPPKGL